MTKIKIERIGPDLSVVMPRTAKAFKAATARLPLKIAELYARPALVDEIKHRLVKDPTGALMRSVQSRFLVNESKPSLSVAVAGSKLVYAKIQDQGGEIRAKRKFLAIPVNLPAASRGKWPRDWPQGVLQLIRARRGKFLLAERDGERLIVRYVLQRSVRLRGAGYVAAAFERMQPAADAFTLKYLRQTLSRENAKERRNA